MQPLWDIFCRVIDNYGDIGVCWRLARQLVDEHGIRVRLWVDDPASLAPLCPACDAALPRQTLLGVEVRHWLPESTVDHVAAVVIEAFACSLPASYEAAMARATPRPRWINLEYLSAESWTESCHGLASPHPSLALTKYFFFPGFTSNSGGLLRERDLPAAPPLDAEAPLAVSLFCYDTAPLAQLIAATEALPQPLHFLAPPGQPRQALQRRLAGEPPWQVGQSSIQAAPFLAQADYDALLRRCAINFVRGEDSFVRAQWAGRPFIWQIYKQEDDAHLVKLAAFLDRYLAAWPDDLATLVRALHEAWNSGGDLVTLWPAFVARRAEIEHWTQDWSRSLREQSDLASRLVKFCADKV